MNFLVACTLPDGTRARHRTTEPVTHAVCALGPAGWHVHAWTRSPSSYPGAIVCHARELARWSVR